MVPEQCPNCRSDIKEDMQEEFVEKDNSPFEMGCPFCGENLLVDRTFDEPTYTAYRKSAGVDVNEYKPWEDEAVSVDTPGDYYALKYTATIMLLPAVLELLDCEKERVIRSQEELAELTGGNSLQGLAPNRCMYKDAVDKANKAFEQYNKLNDLSE